MCIRGLIYHSPHGFECDACLGKLLDSLREAGFHTISSCCGHGEKPPYIVFENGLQLEPTTVRVEGQ